MENISKENAKKLGIDTLLWQTQEECGELIKAIGKYNRTRGIGQKTEVSNEEAYRSLLKEIADVNICLEQLTYLFGAEFVIDNMKNIAFAKVQKRYENIHSQSKI